MKTTFTALLVGLALVSCVPNTPQARIAQLPQQYDALSGKQKELVQRGEIARGMSPNAVYMAWGHPDRVYQGSQAGKVTDRWDYIGTRSVPVTQFYGGYGWGGGYGPGYYQPYHGHHYHGGYSGVGFAMGPSFASIPYRAGTVVFINQRVDSWERAR